jgi:crotonobetainyl-CoA:carnitine CoA-transferase CaiB-like acyl-CoA transferase
VHSNHFFAALCELIGRPELASDARCAAMRSRAAHAAELVPELRAALVARGALEWEEMFGERVPCAAVRPIEDMFDHPQVVAEDLVTTLDHPMVGRYQTMTKPVKFSETPGPVPIASPTFGQYGNEVLAMHDYSAAVIASLRERAVSFAQLVRAGQCSERRLALASLAAGLGRGAGGAAQARLGWQLGVRASLSNQVRWGNDHSNI